MENALREAKGAIATTFKPPNNYLNRYVDMSRKFIWTTSSLMMLKPVATCVSDNNIVVDMLDFLFLGVIDQTCTSLCPYSDNYFTYHC